MGGTLMFSSTGTYGENGYNLLEKAGMVLDYTIEYISIASSKIS